MSEGHPTAVRLISIGFWDGPQTKPGWPRPEAMIDATWEAGEREVVASYLEQGFVTWACMGYSVCRICGKNNGSLELTDGTFVWPEGLRHYVTERAIDLPSRFVSHVVERVDAFETADRDEHWWRSEGRDS
jgi:hypothetical protein